MRTISIAPGADLVIPDELTRDSRAVLYAHGWRTDAARDLYERGVHDAVAELGPGVHAVGLVSTVPGEEKTDFGSWHVPATWPRALRSLPLVLHSGAYRLAVDLIDAGMAPPVIVLLDAHYGGSRQFMRFLEAGGTLVNVTVGSSGSTTANADMMQSAMDMPPGRGIKGRYVRTVTDQPHNRPDQLFRAAIRAVATLAARQRPTA